MRKTLGAAASEASRVGSTWLFDNDPRMRHSIQVAVPFDPRFSKNALWNTGGQGHVYMRQEIKNTRDALIYELQSVPGEWFDGKVWISIFVEKPDARSDAVNVIDLICDAVKKAIGVDDRWFSIRRLDWAIVKTDPMIWVGVAQEVREHHRCCSYCGLIKPLTEFARNKSDKLRGRTRACSDCSTVVDAARKRK